MLGGRDRTVDLLACVPFEPRMCGLIPGPGSPIVDIPVAIKDGKPVMGKMVVPVAGLIARRLMGERVSNVWSGRVEPITGAVYWDHQAGLWFIAAREPYTPQSRVRYFQLTGVEASA